MTSMGFWNIEIRVAEQKKKKTDRIDVFPCLLFFSFFLFRHGTRCAGEVAATNNDLCAIGVAFNASVGGKND